MTGLKVSGAHNRCPSCRRSPEGLSRNRRLGTGIGEPEFFWSLGILEEISQVPQLALGEVKDDVSPIYHPKNGIPTFLFVGFVDDDKTEFAILTVIKGVVFNHGVSVFVLPKYMLY